MYLKFLCYNNGMEKALEQNLNWLIIRASLPAKQVFVALGENYGLTHMQLFTLCLINLDGSTVMHEISKGLRCDASNVTGLVDRLLALGFVERSEHPTDRRIKVIELTAKGREVRGSIMRKLADTAVPGLQSGLSAAEQGTLTALLTKTLQACDAPFRD